jgi:hypothetical protein
MILTSRFLPHLAAGALALVYARILSGTAYVTTAVQFVSPLAVILIVHLAWMFASRQLTPGFAKMAFGRALVTSMAIIALTFLGVAYAPMPADAAVNAGETLGALLGFIACLAVLGLVVGAAAMVLYAGVWAITKTYELVRGWLKRPPGADDSRLFDLGAVGLAFLVIGAASLEGVADAFTFAARDGTASTVTVAAPPARVWQEVGKATSPSFPLPVMLQSIPQPVAVVIDEGAALGARRVVRFKGREGEGNLVLQVSRRTETEAVFEAQSDTSPIAMWVRQKSIGFRVEPDGAGSKLTVSTAYERLLAPAWFFGPYIRAASYLAANVLARDTKQRAEAMQKNGNTP